MVAKTSVRWSTLLPFLTSFAVGVPARTPHFLLIIKGSRRECQFRDRADNTWLPADRWNGPVPAHAKMRM
jgi:hypothetical protein